MQNPDNSAQTGSAANAMKLNRRVSTRYIRNDIGITIRKVGLFDFNLFEDPHDSVKLLDISSRGIQVAANMKLPINKKVVLTMRFANFKEFKILATVMYKSNGSVPAYGIKFDRVHNRLADYLLKTQRKLIFK
ncbi:MAG: PilZ domain-containing protein [Methyloglobulus sp.]